MSTKTLGELAKVYADQIRGSVYAVRQEAFEAELAKIAEAGHWRRLDPNETGKDQAGTQTTGRTWVTRDLMRPGMEPKAHQADFSNAYKAQKGEIGAAHGTGTGKTYAAINAFEKAKGDGRAKRALVVAPAGLRGNFVLKGVDRFTTSKSVILERPGEVPDDTDYVVTSYEAFRKNPQQFIDMVHPDTIIADEFHRASNPNSLTHKAFKQVRPQVTTTPQSGHRGRLSLAV